MSTKRLHDADAAELADQEAIRPAESFLGSLDLGRGRYAKSTASPSLAGGRHWGVLLMQQCKTNSRLLISTLLPDGRQPMAEEL